MTKIKNDQKIYLCGPISGRPSNNIHLFRHAAESLHENGFKYVEVPHDICAHLDTQNVEWADYMRECIKCLMTCDILITLPEWELSRGARLEVELARNLEIPVVAIHQVLAKFDPSLADLHPEDAKKLSSSSDSFAHLSQDQDA